MRIAVIFGGRSSEHDISIITGVMTVNAVSVNHEVIPVYMTRSGAMINNKRFTEVAALNGEIKGKPVSFEPGSGCMRIGNKNVKVDCVINACHGHGGEDGAVSGMLELASIPYAGSDIRASAVGMDKLLFKQVMEHHGMPIVPYIGVNKYEMGAPEFDLTPFVKKVGFPLIVKPCSLGSSIGVGIARDYKSLFELLGAAFMWDRRAVVEKALEDFIELNCAVLGYDDITESSEVEQPVGFKDILSFDDKYCRRLKTEVRKMPAEISEAERLKVRSLATETFKAVGASGVARVDFLKSGDDIYVNEINTVPGSLSEYLFAFGGMTFPRLIDRLIKDAIKVKENKDALCYSYKSDVLCRKKICK